MSSLRSRLLFAASLLLVLFMLLSGAALEEAFRSSAEEVQRDKLQGLVYALLGAADTSEGAQLIIPPGSLPDPRLGRLESGLEALIFDARGKVVWHSNSMTTPVPSLQAPQVGEGLFTDLDDRFALTYGVRWAADTGGRGGEAAKPRRYTVAVLEDKTTYKAQLGVFRRTLWIGLGGTAVMLMVLQVFVLQWGLSPLRKLVAELRRIESGKQSQIISQYPDELTPLASGLNTMILSERSQQTRYRNALDDLAHSLKTPLAVLRGIIEDQSADAALRDRLREPVDRMQEITAHQLRKAAAAGRRAFAEPVPLLPLAEKIAGALGKVYADKRIEFAFNIHESLRARAEQGDLYELLGNLMDNAGKWCLRQIRVSAYYAERKLHLRVEDDGRGFPPDAEQLLKRGVRADTHTPGQGLGLGAAAELVQVYDGRIVLGRSKLGGAQVDVSLSV